MLNHAQFWSPNIGKAQTGAKKETGKYDVKRKQEKQK